MRSVDAHLRAILELVALAHPTPRTESVRLSDAAGRVTGSAHVAASPSPPFDNSAMDGFAVRAVDLARASDAAPVNLRVVGEARAGHAATATIEPGTAIRIMTGAPIPHGADAVVAQELVVAQEGAAQFAAAAAPGAHVRRAGEDVRAGDLVLAAHVKVSARHLAALASAGLSNVSVQLKPRVGYLVTGDELVAPGQPLGPAQIFDSNAIYLRAALCALGAEAIDLGRCGDDPAAVRAIVERAAVDLVVTTGGASVGEHDPVKAGLAPVGVEFVNVAMQPGKPQGAGLVAGKPVVCLPGNPVAVAVSVEMFVGPAVRAMLSLAEPPWQTARAAASWNCPVGRDQLVPVVFEGADVVPATSGGSGSHLVARLGAADALAWVAADVQRVSSGDTVRVRRFIT